MELLGSSSLLFLRNGRFLFPATRIIGSGSGTIWISEANIRCQIPNRNTYVCSSKNCEKRISRLNGKSRQRMPCLSSLSRSHRINMSLRLRLRRQRRYFPLFRICNSRRAYRQQSLRYHSRRLYLRQDTATSRPQLRDHRHGLLFLLYQLENVLMSGVAWRNPNHLIGTRSSTIWRQRSRRGTIPEKHSKPMRIGAASSKATCETSLLMNYQRRRSKHISRIWRCNAKCLPQRRTRRSTLYCFCTGMF